MNRYNISKQLGDGTYGCVLLGTTVDTKEKVAIKKMKKKYYSWDECLSLREVKSLRKLNHPNIVKLKEVVRENDMLYFVFEFMKENLYQMMKDRDKLLPESSVRNITYQILQGLTFMHKHGFFHRDLKPENLLCNGIEQVKIADFGLAREIRSRPPYTDYVSTRWYRAPEVLLRSTNYSSPIDLWAVGCIMAELYTLRPLFPGSSEIDEIFKVCSVLGTPKKEDWSEGYQLAAAMNFRFPQTVQVAFRQVIPNASNDGLQVLRDMLLWNPQKRPSCPQSLRYGFFQVGVDLQRPPPPVSKTPVHMPSQQSPVRTGVKPPSTYPTSYEAPKPTNNYGDDQVGALPAIPASTGGKGDNDMFTMTVSKKASGGRKRWGGGGGGGGAGGLSDTWDEWTDFDFLPNKTSKKAVPTARTNNTKADDDDFLGSLMPKKTQPPKVSARINSGRSSASSAKNHYLSKSRYLPGINPRNSARKENNMAQKGDGLGGMGGMDWNANPFDKSPPLGAITNTNTRTQKPLNNDFDFNPGFGKPKGGNNFGSPSNMGSPAGGGGFGGGRSNFGSSPGGYQPSPMAGGYKAPGGGYQSSFGQGASGGAGAGGYNPSMGQGGWKKAAPLPAVNTKKGSGNAGGNFGPRRTDWASKYLKS